MYHLEASEDWMTSGGERKASAETSIEDVSLGTRRVSGPAELLLGVATPISVTRDVGRHE
jgi:hypothetical protein